ncbi:MAG: hypothetical protein J6N52_08605 [Clostridia bacterium]|nr:hypothetical protein [Clostridia bacterium]
MKFTKRKNTFISLIIGSVIFISASVVGIASSNGYAVYKQSLKNLLTARNYTLELEAGLSFDGVTLDDGLSVTEKVNLDGDVKLNRTRIERNRVWKEYYQDGKSIYGTPYNNNGDTIEGQTYYNVDDVYSDDYPTTLMGDFVGTNNTSEKTADKMIRFLEIASDLVVGDLKNNFIYNGSENGYHSYSISLDNFQIPEIISAGIDLITALNHSGDDLDYIKEWAADNPTYYLYDDVKISNATCDVMVDDEGNISSNNVLITVTGNDWDGNAHTMEINGSLKCYDFGTTEPQRFDIENTENVSIQSERYRARTIELEKILESDNLTDEERKSYEDELEWNKSRAEHQEALKGPAAEAVDTEAVEE